MKAYVNHHGTFHVHNVFFYEIEEVVKCLHALFFLIDWIILGLHHPFQSDRSLIWLRLNRIV